MITRIDDFFSQGCGRCRRFATPDCSVQLWRAGLQALRQLCLDAGLTETVKWGHPCYMQAGRNVVLIGALRSEIRLNFFLAALMTDPASVLEKQGPNTAHPDSLRFTSLAQLRALEPVIRQYLAEARGYAEAGLKAGRAAGPSGASLPRPPELVAALDADPELAAAFARLTPGRQKSHLIALNGAKKADTRRARLEKLRPRILAGLGALER